MFTVSKNKVASQRTRLFVLSVLAVGSVAIPAHATTVFNGSFENVGTATHSYLITGSNLPNWSTSPSGSKTLDCLVFAGSATTNPCGTQIKFAQNPGPSPDGGNYVAIDGDTNYGTPLSQNLTGLIIGQQYTVFFYQASTQQLGFSGQTSQSFKVSLGAETKSSTTMVTPSQGVVAWQSQKLTFTASAVTQALTFMAASVPNGQPPFTLLDGVSITATPEPATFALMGLGLLAFPIVRKLRKKQS